MIDLGNKHLNEQKMVPLVARFKKYLSFIWSQLFFITGDVFYFILYQIYKIIHKKHVSDVTVLKYRQTQKTWSANHHCWESDLNLFLFSHSRRELFKDLSIVLDNLLLAIKKYPRLPLKLRSIKKVNPLDYPWQNQIMKTVHSETGKSIRAYTELFIQNPALF